MQYYSDWGLRIAHGQWTDHKAFYGLPGYAYLLGLFYAAMGFDPFPVALVQAILFAATATMIFTLATQAANSGLAPGSREAKVAGWLAALGWMFFVPAETFATILMPTLWGVAGFWFCLLVVTSRRTLRPVHWLALGIFVGLLATVAATAFALLPIVVAGIVQHARRVATPGPPGHGRLIVKNVLLCLAGCILGIAPAWLHNHLLARDSVTLSSHGGINLWIGNNPGATGYPKMPPGIRSTQNGSMKDSIAVAERANPGRELSRGEVSAYWSGKARDYALSHPVEWLRLAARKLFNFWNAYQYDDVTTIARLRATGVTWPGLSFGVVGCLGLAGLLAGGWKSRTRLFISATILLHMLALLPAFVTERYRLVAVPGLLVLGAWWILDLYQRLARGEFLRAAGPAVIGMAAAYFVSTPQTDASLWSLDFYETGIRETQLGNLDRAQQALEMALRYAPAAPDIQFALGNLCLQRNDRTGAKEYYRRALDLNPRHDGVLNNLGVLALEEKRWDLAERFFVISLQTEPDDAKTFYLLARARFGRGDREGAMRAVDEALRRRPAQREFIELREQIGAAR